MAFTNAGSTKVEAISANSSVNGPVGIAPGTGSGKGGGLWLACVKAGMEILAINTINLILFTSISTPAKGNMHDLNK